MLFQAILGGEVIEAKALKKGKQGGLRVMEVQIIEPDECRVCGWKVTKRNNKDQVIAVENQWIITVIPNSLIWFFGCPSCGCVMMNKNAAENVKLAVEQKKSRIIQPTLRAPKDITPGNHGSTPH